MKYIISWDVGDGPEFEEVEISSRGEASRLAYERWEDAATLHANFDVEDWTEELAEEYGL